MKLLRHVFLFSVVGIISSRTMAQEHGEQINYKLTDIRVDDPDLIVGAGLGMYIPGFVGYELYAMANELIIPGLWSDFRYLQSSGITNDTTTLGDGSEIKLRAGWAFSEIASGPNSVVISSKSEEKDGKRITTTTSLPMTVPSKSQTIFYGTLTQRTANLKTLYTSSLGIEKESFTKKTTTMIGGGVRLQSSENFTANLENYGTFQERAFNGMEVELLMGDSGPFKGLHWVYSMDFFTTPWYWRMSIGSGLSGLEKDMELIDTFMVQIAFGYTFSDSYTKKPIVWDADCYNTKKDDVACLR